MKKMIPSEEAVGIVTVGWDYLAKMLHSKLLSSRQEALLESFI